MIINKSLPDVEIWTNEFTKSSSYDMAITKMTDLKKKKRVFFDRKCISSDESGDTPRERRLESNQLDLQPFYILDYISKQNDGAIYDIGCGFNFFRGLYNVIGVDPHSDHADIKEGFDKIFAEKYKGSMDNVFSINSLHFCAPDKLKDVVVDYIALAKPGGYVYLAINVARIFENVTNVKPPTQQLIDETKTCLKDVIDAIGDDIIYLYQDFDNEPLDHHYDECENGNFRILVKRKP